ncbi:hypothetical protein GDO81_011810 [Engystomops pustulosus]|uniref:Nuclear pore complex protein Nup153 n=1 Tax=Engystomops pustulosus TaxID=76066 RepID=A0AAV7BH76_ENGPU|nr:hypothetical protein GDO81_011810 [Engystomops pustulosus]
MANLLEIECPNYNIDPLIYREVPTQKCFSASSSQQTASTFTPTKSTSSPLSKPSTAFSESSKQALGIWYCSKCLADNKASDSKCASCSTPKELPTGDLKATVTSTPVPLAKDTSTLTSMQGFGEQFKKAPGTWDCDTCLVQNKPETTKCIACETPRPGAAAKAALLLFPTSKSDNPTVPSDSSLTSASLKFEALARKPIGSWECDVCLVQNKAEDGKCIACTSPKPGTSTPVNSLSLPSSAPTTQNQLGLLDQFKKATGTWDCDVCLVNNKAEAVSCVACQSAKPGSKAELPGFGTSSASSTSTLPTIKFGLQSTSNSGELKSIASMDSLKSSSGGFSFPKFSGEIKFGINSSSPSKSTGEKGTGFKFGSSMDEKKDTGFKFGTSTDEKKDSGFKFGTSAEEKKDSSFTFSTLGSTNSSTSSLFSFGKPAEDTTAKPLSGDNLFGSAPSSSTSAPKPEISEVSSSNEKSNLTVSFGFKEAEEKNETPVASGFSFGKTEQKEGTSPFVFGKKDEKSETNTPAKSSFGSKNEGEQPKPFLFGNQEAAKSDAPASVAFSFGVPNTAEKKDADQAAKPVFSFGLPAAATGKC